MVVRWLFLLATVAAHAQTSWDGPLAPVDAGRMITAVECRRNAKLTWSDHLRREAHGVQPGDRVWLITRNGAIPLLLGRPVCYLGECRGNYASLELPIERRSTHAVAIAPLGFLAVDDGARPLRKLSSGAFDLGSGRRLEVRADTCTYARVVGADFAGAWQLVSEVIDRIAPEVLILRDGTQFILWRQYEGIGGPALITLVMSRVEPDESLTFGRRYSAGGQPCD